jgi:TetR/AcrR family transcriptional regulator, lmrAB and yxaGH operons repressor
MAKDVRATMIAGAAGLLSRNGLEGTSFSDVIEATGAPRGSLYHHFPGGKHELVAEAVRWVGARLEGALETPETTQPLSPTQTIELFVGLWRQLLVGSECSAGCGVAAVAASAGADAELLAVTGGVFRGWTTTLSRLFEQGGLTKAKARQLATASIASMEGAVILSRSQLSLAPFEEVARHLRASVDTYLREK